MPNQEFTTAIAIWGAVTGTIGTVIGLATLGLRIRQHRRDRPRLRCDVLFAFDLPPRPNHRLVVRSIGRRPVTVEAVRYYIRPTRLRHRLFAWWHHARGRWSWLQSLTRPIELNEGKKSEIKLHDSDVDVVDIGKVEVIDQTGVRWPVKWPPRRDRRRRTRFVELCDERLERGRRWVEVRGYQLGLGYQIYVRYRTQSGEGAGTHGRGFHISNEQAYIDKLVELRDGQIEAFLRGDTDTID